MNRLVLIKQILLVLAVLYVIKAEVYSPLRVARDNPKNDVQIRYFDPSLTSNNGGDVFYQLNIQRGSDYSDEIGNEFTFCFRLRPTVIDNTTLCTLGNTQSKYECLHSLGNATYNYYQLSADYLAKENIQPYRINRTSSSYEQIHTAIKISLSGNLGESNYTTLPVTVNYKYLNEINQIYEVITVAGQDFINHGGSFRLNYVSTHRDASYSQSTDNLLLQRHYQCYSYNDITNYIFTGGVVRNREKVYFVSFINFSRNFDNFQLWQGLAFSKDKSNRDMLGSIPAALTFEDLYSLYAARPFVDTSTNVGGLNDWIRSAQSKNELNEATYFYMLTVYRNYDTGDKKGDQVLRFKIKNQYCYAAYFQMAPKSSVFQSNEHISYLNPKAMHQMLECFTPNLKLSAQHHLASISTLLIILASFLL